MSKQKETSDQSVNQSRELEIFTKLSEAGRGEKALLAMMDMTGPYTKLGQIANIIHTAFYDAPDNGFKWALRPLVKRRQSRISENGSRKRQNPEEHIKMLGSDISDSILEEQLLLRKVEALPLYRENRALKHDHLTIEEIQIKGFRPKGFEESFPVIDTLRSGEKAVEQIVKTARQLASISPTAQRLTEMIKKNPDAAVAFGINAINATAEEYGDMVRDTVGTGILSLGVMAVVAEILSAAPLTEHVDDVVTQVLKSHGIDFPAFFILPTIFTSAAFFLRGIQAIAAVPMLHRGMYQAENFLSEQRESNKKLASTFEDGVREINQKISLPNIPDLSYRKRNPYDNFTADREVSIKIGGNESTAVEKSGCYLMAFQVERDEYNQESYKPIPLNIRDGKIVLASPKGQTKEIIFATTWESGVKHIQTFIGVNGKEARTDNEQRLDIYQVQDFPTARERAQKIHTSLIYQGIRCNGNRIRPDNLKIITGQRHTDFSDFGPPKNIAVPFIITAGLLEQLPSDRNFTIEVIGERNVGYTPTYLPMTLSNSVGFELDVVEE